MEGVCQHLESISQHESPDCAKMPPAAVFLKVSSLRSGSSRQNFDSRVREAWDCLCWDLSVCQLAAGGAVFESMSTVIMKPFVPLNS
jgi:hypothetical protein